MCNYWGRLWKIENAMNSNISSNLKVKLLERKTQHAVINHAYTANGIKIPTFGGGGKVGGWCYICPAPLLSKIS